MKALAAHKSFALAAKALNISQPSLTRSLKAIEKSLGVQLIDRRGVTPTIFGEIVLRNGERVPDGLSELIREIDLARGLGMGELRVAAGPYPADISAVRAVGVLAARHPKLAVELRIADWGRVAADALESRIDLGLAEITEAARDPDPPWLSLNYGSITKRGRTLSLAAEAYMEIVREIERGIP